MKDVGRVVKGSWDNLGHNPTHVQRGRHDTPTNIAYRHPASLAAVDGAALQVLEVVDTI
jgi:hypothetical protein